MDDWIFETFALTKLDSWKCWKPTKYFFKKSAKFLFVFVWQCIQIENVHNWYIYIYKYIWYIYMVYIQIYIRVLGKGISDVFVETNIILLTLKVNMIK